MTVLVHGAHPRPSSSVGIGVVVLLGLLCLTFAASSSAGENDRVFRDGFEPCCSLGGEVTGLSGDGMILHLQAAGIEEELAVDANAGLPRLYTFAASAPGGTAYLVSFTRQPDGQSCTLSNASGAVNATPIEDIDVSCTTVPGLIWDQGQWDAAHWQ